MESHKLPVSLKVILRISQRARWGNITVAKQRKNTWKNEHLLPTIIVDSSFRKNKQTNLTNDRYTDNLYAFLLNMLVTDVGFAFISIWYESLIS